MLLFDAGVVLARDGVGSGVGSGVSFLRWLGGGTPVPLHLQRVWGFFCGAILASKCYGGVYPK